MNRANPATEVYADASCKTAVAMVTTPNTSCEPSACTKTFIATRAYYTATQCPSNIYKHADDFFDKKTEYLLVDTYTGTDCNTYVESRALLAAGTCVLAGTDGQSAIVTLYSNGSARLTYYLDSTCTRPASWPYLITTGSLRSHVCISDRKYYSNAGGAATSGVGDAYTQNSSSSESKKGGSGVRLGLLAGIIVGVLFVCLFLCLVGFLLYKRRRRRLRSKHDAPPRESHSFPDIGDPYVAQRSPRERQHNTTTTSISDSGGRRGSKIWEDDVVVAARIPREKVELRELLSRGGYGEVYVGSYHGQVVAVKQLLPEKKKTMSQVNAFLSEVKLMATLDHPRIVSFIGVAWDQLMDICVVCEYMAGGDLRALLTEFENDNHPVGFDSVKVKIALHIAFALTYLHSCAPPVIHRDLKSKNILLDEAFNAKVTDFGISRERIDATMTGGIGTSFWMAPEVMMGERYDDKADMFSFGVVLSELDSHVLPYVLAKDTPSSSSSESRNLLPGAAILQLVAAGKMRVHFSDAGPQSMVDLGLACVSLDPRERPTAAEALYKLQQVLASEVEG
ncbi:hypothetical protein PsorP6_011887 [Peronosclerospora sorghi]|uniref:Uncharacterized protein n=1 Tax=Peronosclerospora sorghi TaxID=230839 RepID=A0ACC0WJA3_9STRA|nr:hypothetical protein PsorP6_011887 [Peronosclerospora sorghi]